MQKDNFGNTLALSFDSSVMIYGAGAPSQTGIGFDGFCDICLGNLDGIRKIAAFRELSSDACRIGASGSVRVRRVDSRSPVAGNPSLPVKHVDRIRLKMASFDQHGLHPQSRDFNGRFLHCVKIMNRHASQLAGLVQIGSDQSRFREQKFGQRRPGLFRKERLAAVADHHRIDHERKPEIPCMFRYDTDNLVIAERSSLCGRGRDVRQHRYKLRGNNLRRKNFHRADPLRVLNRQQRQYAGSIDSTLMEGLQVSLNASSSRWIGASNCESHGNSHDVLEL